MDTVLEKMIEEKINERDGELLAEAEAERRIAEDEQLEAEETEREFLFKTGLSEMYMLEDFDDEFVWLEANKNLLSEQDRRAKWEAAVVFRLRVLFSDRSAEFESRRELERKVADLEKSLYREYD